MEDYLQELENQSQGSPTKSICELNIEIPDHVICIISEYLDHEETVGYLALASKYFYLSLQIRYKSLCIKNQFVEKFEEFCPIQKEIKVVQETYDNFPIVKKKSLHEQMIDSKNYMTIYGKMSSKCQIQINLNMLKLDPLNPENILQAPRKYSEAANQETAWQSVPIDEKVEKVLTQSSLFRLVLQNDGTCYIQNTIETEKDIILLPQAKVNDACIQHDQFLIKASKGLYHGQVKKVEDKLEIVSIHGPLQFENWKG